MFGEEYLTPGCYYFHVPRETDSPEAKLFFKKLIPPIAVSKFDVEQFQVTNFDEVPEVIIDPASKLLSLINSNGKLQKSFVLTFHKGALPLISSQEKDLARASAELDHLLTVDFTTIMCLVPPSTVVDLIYLTSIAEVDDETATHSDVRLVVPLVKEIEVAPKKVGFPLRKYSAEVKFKCVQSFGGYFTHYLPQNFYSVDFLCPVGTEVVSCLPGVVEAVEVENKTKGCHLLNFYDCNRVAVRHDNNLVSEYVHLKGGSALVSVGDKVRKGQVLAKSGNTGFSPVPHLHFQLNQGNYSVPIEFEEGVPIVNTFY